MPLYSPPKFKSQDPDRAMRLMRDYPFATVITVENNQPFISHLPLVAEKIGSDIVLIGHLARANPHAKLLQQSRVTAIFHGPHTFITPKWYAENDVPTWNYSVVHAEGMATVIADDAGILDCLKLLTNHVETKWPSGWDFFLPNDLLSPSEHIVGFKIVVDKIEHKMKLSQNRSDADRAGILKGLQSRADEQSKLVLGDMLALYDETGRLK